jgi:hypothetical protein
MTIERPMFPPRDSSRRGFLAVAAGASVASVGALTVAAMPATAPGRAACAVDPIFAALDAFRLAEAEFYAERGDDIPDEIGDRWSDAMDVVIHTQPTTPAGLGALTGLAREMAERSNRGDAGLPDRGWISVMVTIDDATRGMSGLKPWSPPPAAAPVPVGPHPDAELFDAVDRYHAALRGYGVAAKEFGKVEMVEPRPRGYASREREYRRAMNHYGRMDCELADIRAKTLDGLIAKAKAVETDFNVSELLPDSIVEDLLGMATNARAAAV